MLFFDITGASVGDRFQIAGISNEGRAQNPYLSHVTWDIVQVANPIRIEVFTNTGVVNIVGSDTFDYEINGYSVSSAGGSLDTSQWNSLQDQGFGDGNTDPNDGIGWEQLGDGTANLVGEFNLQGSTVVGPNGVSMATLGRLFSIGGTEDLEVELSLANGSSLMPNVVYLTATSVPGDYNGDGTVDAADYTVWRDTLGQSVAEGTGADGSANGIIDAADYGVWRSQFGNSASSGSLSSAPAVPEPTTFCLVAGLGLLVANVARFKRSA
jgi:hypothetical protein